MILLVCLLFFSLLRYLTYTLVYNFCNIPFFRWGVSEFRNAPKFWYSPFSLPGYFYSDDYLLSFILPENDLLFEALYILDAVVIFYPHCKENFYEAKFSSINSFVSDI